MKLSRRALLKAGAAGAASATVATIVASAGLASGPSAAQAPSQTSNQTTSKTAPHPIQSPAATPAPATTLLPAFAGLKPLGNRIQTITSQEFWGRIVLAQRLMNDAKPQFSGLFVTPGTSLYYFTGIHWWPSERLLALVIPRHGDPVMICPAFEEQRLRELLSWPLQILTWQEDQNPYERVVDGLELRSLRTGRIGIEETTRFDYFDGLRKVSRSFDLSSGDYVTVGCRAVKTQHEMDLMRLSCEATLTVYRAVFASLTPGMTQFDVSNLLREGFSQMGLQGDALVLVGKWAAQPHGTREPQQIREGEIVLIDGGTAVEGYRSDITRCHVLGKPSARIQRAFEIVRQAQDAALLAAYPNKPCGSVDDAARTVIDSAGFGPGYKFFTHRLGHGIGLDEHEQPYLVHGNRALMLPGMTFSNEPGIYVPGEYGLRLEDDMFITEFGAAQLLTPAFSPSLEDPVGVFPPPEVPPS
jgi:Xaa-Pro dipeptidase